MDDEEVLAHIARHVALLAAAISLSSGGFAAGTVIRRAKKFEGYLLGQGPGYTVENSQSGD